MTTAESAAERGERLAKGVRLSDYQRQTLVRTVDHWGDEMYRLMEERKETASPERLEWMADQITGWYELADVLRLKRPVR